MADGAAVRVFLLDDHEIVLRGLQDLLESEDGIEVVGVARTAGEALVRAPALQPDVAVLDVRLPDGDGVEVCRELRDLAPRTRCLMLTSHADDEALVQAVLAGAAGYLLKEVRSTDIVSAVRTVAAGGSLLDPRSTEAVLARLRRPAAQDPLSSLTPRERQVLDLVAEGLTNRQAARRLGIAEKTVKNTVSTLLAKLGVSSRTQAALLTERVRRGEPPR